MKVFSHKSFAVYNILSTIKLFKIPAYQQWYKKLRLSCNCLFFVYMCLQIIDMKFIPSAILLSLNSQHFHTFSNDTLIHAELLQLNSQDPNS